MKVVHFHNGTGGGVLSVIRNLLRYSNNEEIENHVIYAINKELTPAYKPAQLKGAVTEQVFYYSPKWNFYYTCRQLVKLLPDDKAVVVAHDWIELGMVSNLGLQNPVVQILHGDFDYYYELAQLHANNIDAFICVSPIIQNKLISCLPLLKSKIFYLRFPIPEVLFSNRTSTTFTVIYFVRDLTDERKQFKKIPFINSLLAKKGIRINWMIAGAGYSQNEFYSVWGENNLKGVHFYGSLPNDEIISLLQGASIMLLPSLSEGFPVAVVEAMKCGVVPLITDWGGATAELVIQNETGFLFEMEAVEEYAIKIEELVKEPAHLNKLSKRARELSNSLFNPYENTLSYENVFLQASASIKKKVKIKAYGSRLDKPWLRNFFTSVLRNKVLKKIKSN